MTIDVLLDGERSTIERSIFSELLENSVVHDRAPVRHALERGEIPFTELVDLARKAEIPYSLFFAPSEFVAAQMKEKTRKLLQGVAPDTFTVNLRSIVHLHDIELIVKDLLRKQAVLKLQDSTLTKNPILGLLRHPRPTVKADADALLEALALDRSELRAARNKKVARDLLIDRLEAKQVLVSQSVRGYMPQLLEVKLSGMTVRDSKVPYIFLAGGDHLDDQEPMGRQIFTLTLMAVLVARGIFKPVTYDAKSSTPNPRREYEIVGETLMPANDIRQFDLATADGIRAAADEFKVTPSAMVVRAMHLKLIAPETGDRFLRNFEDEFRAIPKSRAQQPRAVNAIRKYTGRELSLRMLSALDNKKISAGEFCRVICLNKIHPSQIGEFRAALQ
jgi:hypothetical protein